MLKGSFTDEKQILSFLAPLRIIGALTGENGFNVCFSKNKDDEVIAAIYAKNLSMGVMIIHEWSKLFNGFELDKDEQKIGIIKYNEFIKLFSVFDVSKEITFEVDDVGFLKLEQNGSVLDFRTVDHNLISEGKKTFRSNVTWLTEFEYDKKMEQVVNAMKVLGSEQYLYIKGDADKKKIFFTIRNKEANTNKYSINLDFDLETDFDMAFRKDVLMSIFDCKAASKKIRISDVIINIEINDNNTSTNFFVAKSIK